MELKNDYLVATCRCGVQNRIPLRGIYAQPHTGRGYVVLELGRCRDCGHEAAWIVQYPHVQGELMYHKATLKPLTIYYSYWVVNYDTMTVNAVVSTDPTPMVPDAPEWIIRFSILRTDANGRFIEFRPHGETFTIKEALCDGRVRFWPD